jgi:MSHA biogenesis protein MshQ
LKLLVPCSFIHVRTLGDKVLHFRVEAALPLPVPLEAQYWATGGYYVTNVDDSCTVIPAASVVMGNYVKQLSACATRLSPTGSLTLQSGAMPGGGLILSRPGIGNAGSVDLQVNVTTVAYGNTCVSSAASPATAARVPWFGNSPVARATFGIFKSPLVYRRENY